MEVEWLVALQPAFHFGVLMRAVVVHDQMNLFVFRSLALNQNAETAATPGGYVWAGRLRSGCRRVY